jgi:hypothetical protein
MSTPVAPVTPAPPAGEPAHNLGTLGLRLPWLGAAAGLAGGVGLDASRHGFKNWRRSLRKGLQGAATGVGAELGLRLGGELARRHSVAGGGSLAAGVTPLVTGLAGGAGGYALGSRLDQDDDDEEQS